MKMPFIFPEPQKIEIIKDAFFTYSRLSVFTDDDLNAVFNTVCKIFPDIALERSENDDIKTVFNTVCKIFPDIYLEQSEKSVVRMIKSDDEKDGGYTVSVRPDEITLKYSNSEGAFHALITLCQLITVCGKELPCCEIRDYPALSVRGVMLDISRGKVPTLDTLKAIADKLAIFKINHLQLYIEGISFAYPSYADLYKGETPLTPEEMREFSIYCRERFIDLVPCQNSLGHMARWLSEKDFRGLAECEDGFSVKGYNFPPTTLDVTDENALNFVKLLFDELLPCFDSNLCNACLDEPFELCMGKNSGQTEEKYKLYADYANRLNKYLKERGKQMMMWGDVAAKDESVPDCLDSDIIILDWGYEQEHPFEKRAKKLAQSGHSFCLCPGTNSWLSFTGMTDNMLSCIKNAADAAYKYGAKGLIVTDWGDMGHLQYLPVSYAGILYSAAFAWNKKGTSEKELARALDTFVFKDSAEVMGEFCLDAGRYVNFEEFRLPCRTLASSVLSSGLVSAEEYEKSLEFTAKSIVFFTKEDFVKIYLDSYENRKPINGAAIREYIERLLVRLSKSEMKCSDREIVFAEYENALKTVEILTKLREMMLNGAKFSELCTEIDSVITKHKYLWNKRNKAFGCENGLLPLINIQNTIKGSK